VHRARLPGQLGPAIIALAGFASKGSARYEAIENWARRAFPVRTASRVTGDSGHLFDPWSDPIVFPEATSSEAR
jgi:hypothetical protein